MWDLWERAGLILALGHWYIGGLKESGASKGCAWKCGLMGITVWELNSSYENLKANGKSLILVTELSPCRHSCLENTKILQGEKQKLFCYTVQWERVKLKSFSWLLSRWCQHPNTGQPMGVREPGSGKLVFKK